MKSIGDILTELRTDKGWSQKEVSQQLSKYGIAINVPAICKWEKNTTQPNASQLIALCQVYGVSDIVGTFTDARNFNKLYALNKSGRKKADEYVELLIASGFYDAEAEEENKVIRKLPVYLMPASAGRGNFIDDDAQEMVEVGDEVPANADFGVLISGNSMEPVYDNGQTVWVRRQSTLNEGEVGIFMLNGEAYCKKLKYFAGKPRLISFNPEYNPIVIGEFDEFEFIGKVVS